MCPSRPSLARGRCSLSVCYLIFLPFPCHLFLGFSWHILSFYGFCASSGEDHAGVSPARIPGGGRTYPGRGLQVQAWEAAAGESRPAGSSLRRGPRYLSAASLGDPGNASQILNSSPPSPVRFPSFQQPLLLAPSVSMLLRVLSPSLLVFTGFSLTLLYFPVFICHLCLDNSKCHFRFHLRPKLYISDS